MKFMAIGFLLLFLIVSIGAVSATEEINNETISTDNPIEMGDAALNDEPAVLQSTEYNKYGESETNNTFTDLAKDISTSGEVLEIEKDYKFNNADIRKPIGIVKDNFVINGNNHILDGNGQVSMFVVLGKNITINNLKFVNGYSDGYGGAIIAEKGSLTLNNVTFINNGAKLFGGAMTIVGNAIVNISRW